MAVRYLGHIRPQITRRFKASTLNKLITGGLKALNKLFTGRPKAPTLNKLISGGLKALNELQVGSKH